MDPSPPRPAARPAPCPPTSPPAGLPPTQPAWPPRHAGAEASDAPSGDPHHRQHILQALIQGAAQTALLFDGMPGFVFVLKDEGGRYLSFNPQLPARLGRRHATDLQGRTASDLWPPALAQRYVEQDGWVMAHGRPLLFQLDPIVLSGGVPGWCVTHKYPLVDVAGDARGILCLSRDVTGLAREGEGHGLMNAADLMSKHPQLRHSVPELAATAGVSTARFAQLIRRIYGQSPLEFIHAQRLRMACDMLLHTSERLGEVALACGFYDQAQFSRQFRRWLGASPSEFRARQSQGAHQQAFLQGWLGPVPPVTGFGELLG